ncbi:hypothetical protein [Novosphingobium capsulatum]|uniref:hypothetical protein n=1 Tax=Novosphingobium capsulatum TaxID=13688 RepID=UPI0007894C94|nr:hypothetical protein [Novosphingobium capsulatum]WQD93025.1 hypothetical protein U0041_00005 [Novosphingobium capsulatum]
MTDLLSWDTGAIIPLESYVRLRANPGYPSAIRWLARAMLESADADPAIAGILKDAGRKVAALCTAMLHVSGGITLPRLKELMTQLGLASPGRARLLLIYMDYLRFIEVRPARPSHSPAVYLPTDKFLNTYTAHLRQVVEATAWIAPAAKQVAGALDDPRTFHALVRHLTQGFLDSSAQGHDVDNYFQVFSHRHAGAQILNQLVSEAPGDSFPPTGSIPFAVATAARRFHVSRPHIRRLFQSAVEAQLIELNDGAVTFTDAGQDMIEWVFATKMIVYLGAVARTFRDVSDQKNVDRDGIAA